jgi:hypothetical protein
MRLSNSAQISNIIARSVGGSLRADSLHRTNAQCSTYLAYTRPD